MTNARRTLATAAAVTLIVAGVGLFTTARAAGSANTTLGVAATVKVNCSISTVAVAFIGQYDPLAVSDLTGQGTIKVACTKGAVTRIDLDLGLWKTGSARRLKNGAEYLTYELFSDAPGGTVWGSTADGTGAGVAYTAGSKAETSLPVFASVTAAQDVSAGTFNDTVAATINF
jgi:spore coat protein U-like protein